MKKILIVEHDFSSRNCTTKGLFASLEKLAEAGCEIDVWANTWEEHSAIRHVRKIGALRRPWILRYLSFIVAANLAGVFERMRPGRGKLGAYDVIHTSNGLFLFANLSTFHFSEFTWVCTQLRQLRPRSLRDLYEFFSSVLAAVFDFLQLRRSSLRVVAVSDSIAEELARIRGKADVGVLPNAYDGVEFSSAAREGYRLEVRREFRIPEETVTFCFCANGTHRRKGFWLMLDSLMRLRKPDKIRVLVIGGSEATLRRLRTRIARCYAPLQGSILFTGQLENGVARYMSACDALLFPSYFEAFSLVEIEAAALGLRLFLTPHHGTEMILEEGVNGRMLSFDAADIARVLEEELERGISRVDPPGVGRALSKEQYAEALVVLYSEVGEA